MLSQLHGSSSSIRNDVQSRSVHHLHLATGAITVFGAAFLVITIQPLVGILLLPAAGGHPLLWQALQVSFQILLLLGYLAASRCRLVCLTWFLPVGAAAVLLSPSELVASPKEDVTLSLWSALTSVVVVFAVPFSALSTASVLMQRLAVTAGSREPVWLYAVSNSGSLTAAVGYPFLVQPNISAQVQLSYWQVAAAILLVILGLLARIAIRFEQARGSSARLELRLSWVAAGFLPVALTLAVTTYLTVDLGSHPIAWLAPFSSYLLATAVAFTRCGAWLQPAALLAVPGSSILALFIVSRGLPVSTDIVGAAVLLMLTTMLNFALTRWGVDRQPVPEALPGFYVSLASGGILAATLVTFMAPMVLNPNFFGMESNSLTYRLLFRWAAPEVVFVLLGANVLLFPLNGSDVWSRATRLIHGGLLGVLTVGVLVFARRAVAAQGIWLASAIMGALALVIGAAIRNRWRTGLAIGGAVALGFSHPATTGVVRHTRDQLGQLIITDTLQQRTLTHGTTYHGSQPLGCIQRADETGCDRPTGYYTQAGPLGAIIASARLSSHGPVTIVAIGLGVGTVASYCVSGDSIRFIEINAQVVHIARQYFRFIEGAEQRCAVMLDTADGRVGLRIVKDRSAHILVVDAFSSDAVPPHLLTLEALREYTRVLKPDGVIAFHISNRFFDLTGPLQALAIASDMTATFMEDDGSAERTASIWAALAATWPVVQGLGREIRSRPHVRVITVGPTKHLWTDGRYNLLSAFR